MKFCAKLVPKTTCQMGYSLFGMRFLGFLWGFCWILSKSNPRYLSPFTACEGRFCLICAKFVPRLCHFQVKTDNQT
jgi:hypothetical protein